MKMLCKVKLSEHKYKTPEGYLYCKDAIIARTGKQTYLESEIFEGSTSNDYIEVDRREEEVFSPQTMASFENKPLTIEHPNTSVGPENYKDLSVGHVQNVRKGEYEGQPVMMADIVVNDAEAIRLIESGEMVELSCGYDCDITDGPNPEQVNIRGNHVALCEAGRAGIAMIVDSKWGVSSVQDSVSRGTLIQEFGKQGKQYKIAKIVGNVIYAESLENERTVLFKKDEENIEWAVITKSEVKDSKVKDGSIINAFIKGSIEKLIAQDYTYDEILKELKKQYPGAGSYDIQKAYEDVTGVKFSTEEIEKFGFEKGSVRPRYAIYNDNDDFCGRFNTIEEARQEIEKFKKYNKENGIEEYFRITAEDSEVKDDDWDFMRKIREVDQSKLLKALKEICKSKQYDDLTENGSRVQIANLRALGADQKEKLLTKLFDSVNDSSEKQFIICLEDKESWLDMNDKPTSDKSKARRFNTKEEAESHMNSYCKGSVEEFVTDTYIEDRLIGKEIGDDKLIEQLNQQFKVKNENGYEFVLLNNDAYCFDGENWHTCKVRKIPESNGGKTQNHRVFRCAASKFDTVISYAKLLYCSENKVTLPEDKEIDHLNGDHMDDRLNNYEVVTSEENNKRNTLRINARKQEKAKGFVSKEKITKDFGKEYLDLLINNNSYDKFTFKDSDESEKKVCCICGKEFTEWGNNPWPVKEDGQCCDECNQTKVIPARLKMAGYKDAMSKSSEGKEIETLLKDIIHGKIDESPYGSITIDFDNKSQMRKAAKKLVDNYDIELVEDDNPMYIAIYEKYEESEPTHSTPKDSKNEYSGFDLRRGEASKDFKQYLRDRGLYFEPSSNGDFVHFEVKNADDDVYLQANAIRRHWAKAKGNDAYSKKFYSKMLKELQDKLDKLEKNEMLDENNHIYEKQKNKMKENLKKQIKEYEEKLKA